MSGKTPGTKEEGKPTRVPRLRFPEFRGTGGWEESPLSKFILSLDAGVSVNAGDRPANKTEFGVLKTSAITTGSFEPEQNKVVLVEEEKLRLEEPATGGTIIICRKNTPALVGASAYVESSHSNLFLPDLLWVAKPREGVSMRFLAFILSSDIGRAALSRLAKGSSTSMINITKPDVLAFLVMVPSAAEQQKIAECLTSLDEVIAAQARRVDALKTHKKGLMQQLFPREGETQPRLRFPEFREAGEWEVRTIGDLRPFVTSGSRGWATFYADRGELFVRITNLCRGSIYLDLTDSKFVQLPPGENEGVRTQLKEHDVLISITADIGIVGYVDASVPSPAYVNQHIALVRFNALQVCAKFVAYFLTSERSKRLFRASADSGAKAGMNLIGIQKIALVLPGLLEQQHIADCLSSLDALITAATQKLEALKLHKRGLMQQLFASPKEVET